MFTKLSSDAVFVDVKHCVRGHNSAANTPPLYRHADEALFEAAVW